MPEYKLSDAELHIMRQFWAGGPMQSDELAALVKDRNWKNTTLLTFLSRLAAKGMLAVEKRGKSNLYSPLVTKGEYTQSESRAFLDQMHGGSARNFLASLVEGQAITADELDEMRQWLNRQEVEPHE